MSPLSPHWYDVDEMPDWDVPAMELAVEFTMDHARDPAGQPQRGSAAETFARLRQAGVPADALAASILESLLLTRSSFLYLSVGLIEELVKLLVDWRMNQKPFPGR